MNAKESSNYHTIAFISHATKVILKTLQGRLQQNVNRELTDETAGFRKGGKTRDQITNHCWITERAREFQKKKSACASSSPAFLMMYSAYKLNKQGDSIQPWCTAFPFWNQSVVPCSVLTVASWPAYRFLRRQVRRSYIPISLRIFHFCYDPRSQRL